MADERETLTNLRAIFELGGVLQTDKYQLFFRPEAHPLDETWGYAVVDTRGRVDQSFGYNLEEALGFLVKLMGKLDARNTEIPF